MWRVRNEEGQRFSSEELEQLGVFGVDVAEGLFELGDITQPPLVAGGVDPGF
jgi:hypothetical protein